MSCRLTMTHRLQSLLPSRFPHTITTEVSSSHHSQPNLDEAKCKQQKPDTTRHRHVKLWMFGFVLFGRLHVHSLPPVLPLPSQLAQERPTLGLLQFPCVRLRQRNAPVTAHIREDPDLHALTAWRCRRAASCTQGEGPRERVPGQVLIGEETRLASRFDPSRHQMAALRPALKTSDRPFASCFCLFFSNPFAREVGMT